MQITCGPTQVTVCQTFIALLGFKTLHNSWAYTCEIYTLFAFKPISESQKTEPHQKCSPTMWSPDSFQTELQSL